MSAFVVLKQMIMMFLLIMTGYFLYKRRLISSAASKDMSALVVNVCSPALIISSVLSGSVPASRSSTGIVALLAVCSYFILIFLAYILVRLLRITIEQQDAYLLMTIFGNLGYIGIPVSMAVIGPESIIYVAIFNFISNVFLFTFGIKIIKKGTKESKNSWTDIFTPGFISCMIAFVIYWFQIQVPADVITLLHYFGDSCTMLSLLVIGMSLVGLNYMQMITDRKMIFFILIRFLLIPILAAVLIRMFITDYIMKATIVLMLSLPVANLPMMLLKRYGKETDAMSKGIIMTTICSIATISIVFLFV